MEHLRLQKPIEIKKALNCIWAGLALAIMMPYLDWHYIQNAKPQISVTSVSFALIITIVIYVWLINKVSKGRNWARITFLVLVAVGSIPNLQTLIIEFNRSIIIGCNSALQLILQFIALWLLFTKPGSTWFKP